MKRLHIHVNTTQETFAQSTGFYSTLFNSPPTKQKEGYAKWLLEDPKMNFVVEVQGQCSDSLGIHHVGIQVDESAELNTIKEALKAVNAPLLEVGKTTCCYSESEKNWTQDPSGIRWETFRSVADIDNYGEITGDELNEYNK